MRRIRASAFLLGVLLFAACIPTPPNGKARTPNTGVPSSFLGQTDAQSSAQLKWSEFFTDPKLKALIETALKNNQELNIVSLELNIAQNEVMARRSEYLPKAGIKVGVGIEKVGQYTSQGASDEAHGVPQHLPEFSLGLSASWEIDVWSKLRNATRAAIQRYLASQEGRNFAITMLVGELATSYYELTALDAQLDVMEQNIAIQQNALTVVKLQKEAAKVTELAVKRFQAEVLKNQGRQYTIRQKIVETENKINFLIGRFPQHVDRSTERFTDLVPPIIHAGLPAQLLANRPDLKRAQLDFAASELDVKVARAAFYPSLGLNASIGLQSFDITKLISLPASLAYGILADILAPLFNRQALTAAYFTSNSKQMQAVFSYERAILSSFVEVMNLLSMIRNLEQSYTLQAQQVGQLTQSIDISSKLFASARADYMEVLLTRRDALEAQMELIENKKQQLNAAVSLYRALGGGWR